MPPTAVSAPSRGPTKLQKPIKARYFKGKPVGADAADLDDDDSDEDDEEQVDIKPGARRFGVQPVEVDKDVVAGGAGRIFRPGQGVPAVKMELGGVQLGKGKSQGWVEEEEVDDDSSGEEETDDEEEELERKPELKGIKPPGSEVGLWSLLICASAHCISAHLRVRTQVALAVRLPNPISC